jgi:hypothetical protein
MLRPADVPQPWEAFVERFREGWANPQVDHFIAHFKPLFEPDAALIQPLSPTVSGHNGLEAVFRSLFTIVPDLRGEVIRWGAGDDALFVEIELTAKIGRRTVKVRGVDHFLLTPQGTVIERWSFLDPLPWIGAILRSPRSWRGVLRARRGSRRRLDTHS